MNLESLGWSPHFERCLDELEKGSAELKPARVIRSDRKIYTIKSADAEVDAEITGAFLHRAKSKNDFPTIGDWTAAEFIESPGGLTAKIHHILPRKSAFTRRTSEEKGDVQVVAANVDVVFLVSGLDKEYNPRRVERYLTTAQASAAEPVIILNKTDKNESWQKLVEELKGYVGATEIIAMSAQNGEGLMRCLDFLGKGKTAAFLGSSGVGKSTIVNALLGRDVQRTALTYEDEHGKHTTTRKDMFFLPNDGGMIIDTPGLREIRVWGDESSVSSSFEDLDELAAMCKFRNCTHSSEPGCAVLAELEKGSLDRGRYESYIKLSSEIADGMKKSSLEAKKGNRPGKSAFKRKGRKR